MGADAVMDYTTEDLKERAKELTGGGADIVIDPVGGPYAEAALRAMRWGGRFVVIGFASGEIPRIPLNLVLLKGVTVTAFEFRGFQAHAPEALARGDGGAAGDARRGPGPPAPRAPCTRWPRPRSHWTTCSAAERPARS